MHVDIKNNSNEFLANLLGWIYIFAFIFMLGCYIYGLSGISDKESFEHDQRHLVEIAPMRGAIDKKSFKYDEGRLAGIAFIRCAIEKYIVLKGKLPQGLYEEELRVGSTDSPAGAFAKLLGITYRIIEESSDKYDLICPKSDAACGELIADNNNFFLYELCANFKLDFGDEERALMRLPTESSFPSSDYCGGIQGMYHMNPKHSNGRYCYIFYSPQDKKNYPSFIRKLNSYDDFYDKYFKN